MALERLLNRDRWIVAACLALAVLAAWLYLAVLVAAMDGSDRWRGAMALMPMGAWGARDYALAIVMWSVMMLGMMVPSAAPMILLHARVARRAQERGGAAARTGFFAAGYLLAWTGFSAVATLAQGLLVNVSVVDDEMASGSRLVSGAILVLAGLYQWSAPKQACLTHCRSPVDYLARHWRDGAGGALIMGARHGLYCVGCCGALMAVLFVVGVMNLAWVAALAAWVAVEKLTPFGQWAARLGGTALCLAGVATIAAS